MEITKDSTIGEAKAWLRANWFGKRPVKCPCCTRNVQLKEYEMTAQTIDVLQALWDTYGSGRTFHLPTEVTRISLEKFGKPGRNGDVAMVRHWKLIEKVGKGVSVIVGDQRVAGTQIADYVCLPELGDFLDGKLAVPAWVRMFDGKFIEDSKILVTVDHFLAIGVELEEDGEEE